MKAKTKSTTSAKKRLATRRRNAATREEARLRLGTGPNAAQARLAVAGAYETDAILRRLQWVAEERGLPVAEVQAVMNRNVSALAFANFAERHGISLAWLMGGDMQELRASLRGQPRRRPSMLSPTALLELYGQLSPEQRRLMTVALADMVQKQEGKT